MPNDEDGDGGTGKRVPTPSYEKLCEEVNEIEHALSTLLGASDADLAATQQRYHDLKVTRDTYNDAAHKLEAYLKKVGSTVEVEELRRSRRELRLDLKEAIQQLNKLLQQEGIEVRVLGDITNTSITSISTSQAHSAKSSRSQTE